MKKQFKYSFSVVMMLALGLKGLQAQTMYVLQKSGAQTSFAVSKIRKITFGAENLNVVKSDNTAEVFAINGLRYINFKSLVTEVLEFNENGFKQIIPFPNPFENVLNIDLGTKGTTEGTVSILDLEGRLLMAQHINGLSVLSFDVQNLKRGYYLCKYNLKGVRESEFIKLIKQ